jgi:hypothetical protein
VDRLIPAFEADTEDFLEQHGKIEHGAYDQRGSISRMRCFGFLSMLTILGTIRLNTFSFRMDVFKLSHGLALPKLGLGQQLIDSV